MSKASSVVKPLTGVKKFISVKVKRFLEGYEEVMLKRFPSTYRMIQMFTIGTKNFSSDVLKYMKISKDLTFNRPVSDITYKELSIYMKTPKDLRKMIPFLVVTSIPFAQYITLPLAFMFPKHLLSSHYWSNEQRSHYAIQNHAKKLYHYRPLFRHLQKKLYLFGEKNILYDNCYKVLAKLASGTHPTTEEILKLIPLFTNEPYGLDFLTHSHLISLCKIHEVNILPGKKFRLKEHIYFIKELDEAWTRENVQDKSLEDIKKACFLRGLNATNLNQNEMINWLDSWCSISKYIKEENLSLMLHLPIFLTYNHPSNWRIIH